jgi:hypothetical protein
LKSPCASEAIVTEVFSLSVFKDSSNARTDLNALNPGFFGKTDSVGLFEVVGWGAGETVCDMATCSFGMLGSEVFSKPPSTFFFGLHHLEDPLNSRLH